MHREAFFRLPVLFSLKKKRTLDSHFLRYRKLQFMVKWSFVAQKIVAEKTKCIFFVYYCYCFLNAHLFLANKTDTTYSQLENNEPEVF